MCTQSLGRSVQQVNLLKSDREKEPERAEEVFKEECEQAMAKISALFDDKWPLVLSVIKTIASDESGKIGPRVFDVFMMEFQLDSKSIGALIESVYTHAHTWVP